MKWMIIVFAISLVVSVFLWFKPEVTPLHLSSSVTPQSSSIGHAPAEHSHQNAHLIDTFLSKLSETSLKGTDVDGLYPVDADGNLVLSNSIKHRFEYFLSTMGEFPLEEVLEMVREDISLNLSSPAKEQALALFDDYVAYKYALADLEASLQAPQDYEIQDIQRFRFQLDQLRAVRRDYLSSEAVDAFFGFDEIYDDFMLSRLEIQNNQQLSAEEKQAQLSALEQTLPSDVKEMRDETQRVSQVFKVTEDMKTNGADEADIYSVREQAFGQDAALRLKALDQQRAQWQNRVDTYLAKRKAIISDDARTPSEQQAQLDDLRQTSFSDQEQARLSAFEIMAEQQEANH